MPRLPHTPFIRLSTSIGAGALFAALLLQPQAGLAKLSAAPGDDGAPPDPQDEAEVDALKQALSDLSIEVPVTLLTLGLPIERGSVIVDGGASYRDAAGGIEWCLSVHDYEITGFDPLTRAMIAPRLNDVFDGGLFCAIGFI
jgi:hypothetical protein